MSQEQRIEAVVDTILEDYRNGRDIDKIYVQSGEREGSIRALVAEASERRIPIVECDRAKLDRMACGASHQGIIALSAERNYATVEEILAVAAERGELGTGRKRQVASWQDALKRRRLL